MLDRPNLRWSKIFLLTAGVAYLALLPALLAHHIVKAAQNRSSDPWTPSQLNQPADLARELSDPKNTQPPTIVYVGFHTLYEGGHIPGSVYPGQAGAPQGLAALKKWAEKLPRTANLVVYCGCCPFDQCPNIRPAVAALHEMGFTRLRVLDLPKSFAADWIAKGYPVKKGN